MDPREIEGWPAALLEDYRQLYILEPFGPDRDNWHSAQIAHILAQVHHDRKRGAPPRLSQFFYEDPFAREARKLAEADSFFFGAKKKA